VYEPLRCQRAYLSRYTKATKSANLCKPAASNGLYTMLAAVIIFIPIEYILYILKLYLKYTQIVETLHSSINSHFKHAEHPSEYLLKQDGISGGGGGGP
jgi:hypothetical protein